MSLAESTARGLLIATIMGEAIMTRRLKSENYLERGEDPRTERRSITQVEGLESASRVCCSWTSRARDFVSAWRYRHDRSNFAAPVNRRQTNCLELEQEAIIIRKLKSGKYRLYSRKKDPKTGKRRNLGTFDSKEAAEKHEREVQYFKRH